MKSKIKTIKKLLIRGDNKRIAELTGFTEQYISRTLRGHCNNPHPLIIDTALKIIKARYNEIDEKLTSK
ncbi:MAG TPA: hypothetical protein VIO15_10040 [Bacteroidales bacterium]